ncbi:MULTISPECIES: hypothetical protein [Priestia]|nr:MULTISPECIES: hypothetical protein [Priestia]MDY0938663.1 hypothetical protein [Priestia megaterium]
MKKTLKILGVGLAVLVAVTVAFLSYGQVLIMNLQSSFTHW